MCLRQMTEVMLTEAKAVVTLGESKKCEGAEFGARRVKKDAWSQKREEKVEAQGLQPLC